MIPYLILAGVAWVLLVLLAAIVGEVLGLNGRLDAADEEDEDWCWPHRIDDYGIASGYRTAADLPPLRGEFSDHGPVPIDDQRRD